MPRLQIFLLTALGAALALGCKDKPAAPKTPIVVGAVLPLTGAQAAYGVAAKSGIELAAASVEQTGLRGRRLQVLFLDDGSEAQQAVAATGHLVKRDRARVILGGVSSGPSMAMAPLAERARIPMISPSATHPELTRHGPFVFRTCFADPLQAQLMARYAKQAGLQKVGVLRDLDSTYSLELSTAFEAEAKAQGLEVVKVTEFTGADASLEGPLSELEQAGAQAVYLPSYVRPVKRVLEAALKMKVSFRFLGTDGWDARALAALGPAAEGSVFVSHFFADPKQPKVAGFVEAFRERFNEDPDAYAALGYDTAMLAIEAIRRAKSDDPEAIRDALAGIEGFEGVTGKLSFGAQGDPDKQALVLEVKDGARRRVRSP